MDRLEALCKQVQEAGLELEVIESVNIHEDIKKGLPSRDKYIQNYIITLENLSKIGVKCLCYNFMPVMDWLRSDLAYTMEDGSTVLMNFTETAHLSTCGDLDMYEVVKAFQENGFNGYIRSDHGRMIWGEKARPGYGLYDRALGAIYLWGLWEAIKKQSVK
jgi:D-mannonate dehydratase